MAPLTDEHPPAMLDSTNAAQYSRGHLGEYVTFDGKYVRAPLLVTDAGLNAKIESGALSCG